MRERGSSMDDDAVLLVHGDTQAPPSAPRSPPVPRALKVPNALRSRPPAKRSAHRDPPRTARGMYSVRSTVNNGHGGRSTQRRVIEILKTLRKPSEPTKMATRSGTPHTSERGGDADAVGGDDGDHDDDHDDHDDDEHDGHAGSANDDEEDDQDDANGARGGGAEEEDDEWDGHSIVIVADSDGSSTSEVPERRRTTRSSLQDGFGAVCEADSPISDDGRSPPRSPGLLAADDRKLRSASRGARTLSSPSPKRIDIDEKDDSRPRRRGRNVAVSQSATTPLNRSRPGAWLNMSDSEWGGKGMGKGKGKCHETVNKINRIDIHQSLTVVVEADNESLPCEVTEGYDVRHTRSVHAFISADPQRSASPPVGRARSPFKTVSEEASKMIPSSPWAGLPRLPSVVMQSVDRCMYVSGIGKLNVKAIVDLHSVKRAEVMTPSFVASPTVALNQPPFQLPSRYLTWSEPSFWDVQSSVEYELDDEDAVFLAGQVMSEVEATSLVMEPLRPDDFEELMDLCEKEVVRQDLLPPRPNADSMPFSIKDDDDTDDILLTPDTDSQPKTMVATSQHLSSSPSSSPTPPVNRRTIPARQPRGSPSPAILPVTPSTRLSASPKVVRPLPGSNKRPTPKATCRTSSNFPSRLDRQPPPPPRFHNPTGRAPPKGRREDRQPDPGVELREGAPDIGGGCGVCGCDRGVLTLCQKCGMRAHLACYYGIKTPPQREWTCRRCMDDSSAACTLCDNACGALFPVPSSRNADGGHATWVHPACALALKSKSFLIPSPRETGNPFATDAGYLDMVCDIELPVNVQQGHDPCFVCGRGRHTIKCTFPGCDHHFHANCALKSAAVAIGGRTAAVQAMQRRSLCPVHLDMDVAITPPSFMFEVPLAKGRGLSSSLDGQHLQFELSNVCSIVATQFGARRARLVPPCFWRHWLFKRLRNRHRSFTPRFQAALQRKHRHDRLTQVPPTPAVKRAIVRHGLDTFMRPKRPAGIQSVEEYRQLLQLRPQMERLRLLINLTKNRERHKLVRMQLSAQILRREYGMEEHT